MRRCSGRRSEGTPRRLGSTIGCRGCIAQALLCSAPSAQQTQQEYGTENDRSDQEYACERAAEPVVEKERREAGTDRQTRKRSEPAAHARGLRSWRRCSLALLRRYVLRAWLLSGRAR